MVVRAIRFGGTSGGAQHAGWAALHTVIWVCTTLLLLWVAYTFIPGVGDVVDNLTWAAGLTLDNLSETIVSNDFALLDII